MRERYALDWWALADGYEFVKVFDKQQPPARAGGAWRPVWLLTNRRGGNSPGAAKQYSPFAAEHLAMFRTFAELSAGVSFDQQAIVGFADRYGLLRDPDDESRLWRFVIYDADAAGPDEVCRVQGAHAFRFGDLLSEWCVAIDEMRRAVEMWDAFKKKSTAAIQEFFRFRPSVPADLLRPWEPARDGWLYDSMPRAKADDVASRMVNVNGEAIAVPRVRELVARSASIPERDLTVAIAAELVQKWINWHLETRVVTRLGYDRDNRKWIREDAPRDLHAALWLQFRDSIAGAREQRRCKQCGEWFDVPAGDDARTKRREFCGDPCKSKDRRRRMEHAQQMKAEGKPPKEIAKELDTDLNTIKKWTAKRKG